MAIRVSKKRQTIWHAWANRELAPLAWRLVLSSESYEFLASACHPQRPRTRRCGLAAPLATAGPRLARLAWRRWCRRNWAGISGSSDLATTKAGGPIARIFSMSSRSAARRSDNWYEGSNGFPHNSFASCTNSSPRPKFVHNQLHWGFLGSPSIISLNLSTCRSKLSCAS